MPFSYAEKAFIPRLFNPSVMRMSTFLSVYIFNLAKFLLRNERVFFLHHFRVPNCGFPCTINLVLVFMVIRKSVMNLWQIYLWQCDYYIFRRLSHDFISNNYVQHPDTGT